MFDDFPSETVAELQARGVLRVEDGNHGNDRPRSDEFGSGDTAFIRAADMDAGRVLFESAEKINDVALARIRKGKGKPGDILFSSKGTVGKLALVQMNAPPFVCSPQTTLWRTLDENQLDRAFLYAFMQSAWFIEQWEAIKGDTDMADYASLTSQRDFRVPLPEIKVQRDAANVFRPLDDKIGLNRRMNRTMEELATALFRSWFVDFDPVVAKAAGRKPAHLCPELAALFSATFQDSELGPIPKGWRVLPLGGVCTLKRGYDLAEQKRQAGDVPIVSSAGIKSSHSEAKVKGPGVITGRYGTIGDVFFVEEDFWPLNTTLYVQDFKGHAPRFVFHTLQGIDYGIYADKAAVPGVNRNDLHQEVVICPPANLESEFDKLTAGFWKQHSANEKESRTLAALRDTLLPKLLSGELRVKQAEKQIEAVA